MAPMIPTAQASVASGSVTATELEVEPHDDDDVYPDSKNVGGQEHGEEEIPTEDEFVDVLPHEEEQEEETEECLGEPTGTPMDNMDTLPHMEESFFHSDDDKKGAHKVG